MESHLSLFQFSSYTLLSIASIVGFYAAYVARWIKLPSIIGYMAAGVLLGPSLLNIFTSGSLETFAFIPEIALGFVALSIGAELSLTSLKKQGWGIVSIIFSESFGAFIVVVVLLYLLTRDLPLALIFGAMAPASAPAGTVAVIQEYKAKGSLTKALYAVVGFDDGLAIVIFAFAAALAKSLLIGEATGSSGSILPAMWAPAKEIVLSLGVGGLIGFLLTFLLQKIKNTHDILILLFAAVLAGIGLSMRWHLSLILTNMGVGFVLANLRSETVVRRIMAPLSDIMPLVFILFFFLAGAHLKLFSLPSLGLIGVVYILGRTIGLMGGARIGGQFGNVEDKVKKYIGLGILSQAGVAIGLSLIVNQEFSALASEYNLEHAQYIATTTLTTVTATCIFFEVIGPIGAKIALQKAGEISPAHK